MIYDEFILQAELSEIALQTDFILLLIVAAAMGFVATRTGQPTIIAYILTGILLGPAIFDLVEAGQPLIETMAELGLAFLLFLLGIKMRFDEIRHVLTPIVKISLPQMTLVALAGIGLAIPLGFSTTEAIIIGLAVMYSSTAVIIKMLTDKGEATSLHGKIDVGVLLVQDIIVVILLAVLATGQPDGALEIVTTLGTILVIVVIFGAAAVLASQYLLPPVFRRIADNTDVFFLVAVSWAFLFVFLSQELGLSIEMGAFLAGLAIAQLPYSKELQDRVNPLTDLFLLIFFASVSLELAPADLFEYWQEAIAASLLLMPAKFVIYFLLIDWQDFDIETTFLGSVNMIQVSEFGLIVGAAAVAGGFVNESILGFLTLVALFTMSVSVYVIQYNRQLYSRVRPYLDRWEQEEPRTEHAGAYKDHAVVIGYDEITRRILPLLDEHYEAVIIIDRNTDNIEAAQEAGYKGIFGDIRYEKIRKEAAIKKADLVFSSSVEGDVNKLILEEAGSDTIALLEAQTTEQARELYELGAHYVMVSPQLAADRLYEYLDLYLEDRDQFASKIQSEVEFLSQGIMSPRPTGGESDD